MTQEEGIIPSLCSVTFRTLTPEDLVPLAADNGVRAIEWGADVHVPVGDPARARQVSELCHEHGIDAASYGSYVRAGDDTARQAFSQVLDTAQTLGANNIRVWAGRQSAERYTESERQNIADDLFSMAESAAGQNITLSVEFHRNTLTENLGSAVELLTAANHHNLFSYWQPVPGRTLEERLTEITTLSPWLGHLHVFHWLAAGDQDERRALAEGAELWQPVIQQWKTAAHWKKPRLAMLEFVANDDVSQFRQDMNILRQWCKRC